MNNIELLRAFAEWWVGNSDNNPDMIASLSSVIGKKNWAKAAALLQNLIITDNGSITNETKCWLLLLEAERLEQGLL